MTVVIYVNQLPSQLIRGSEAYAQSTLQSMPAGTVYLVTSEEINGLHDCPAYDEQKVTIL